MRPAAWLVVAAGCGSAAPAPVEPAARPAAASAPCAPSVAWANGGFVVQGLPCVARDGARVVFARSDKRPRFPDLTLVSATRADAPDGALAVMEPHELRDLLDARRAPTPALDARIRAGNQLLRDLAPTLVVLPALAPAADGSFAGAGVVVQWSERGRVSIRRGGKLVHDADHAAWLEQLTACSPPSYLAAVWADATRGVALLEIAYRGSGGCTAMPELHVVAWTP